MKEFKMGYLDENGNLVEIPENIQKHIEAREEFWVDKIKDIDSKCGIVLERLALAEKALELACEDIGCDVCPLDETICASVLGTEDGCAKAIAKCYLEEAKEMMKSE